MKDYQQSRLSKRYENKTKKSVFLTTIGSIIIIVLIIIFGVPLLTNFSQLLTKKDSSDTFTKQDTVNFVAPPILDPTFDATSSAKVTVTGSAQPKEVISLYANDVLIDKMDTKDDGSFKFDHVTLELGTNTIKTKAENGDKKYSDFSNPLKIVYKNQPPSLTIDAPADGATYSKDNNSIAVSGKTDPNVKVTVNGFWAIVDNKGNYSYNFSLQNGENDIKVDAVDDAGNKTEMERKITYNQ